MKLHKIKLSLQEREQLQAIALTGTAKAQESTRARILLAADQGEHGPAAKDTDIASVLGVAKQTVEQTRKRYVTEGLIATVYRATHKNKGVPTKVDGRVEARIIALACSTTPNEEPRWTLSMLADQVVQLELVDSISRETVRQILKKTRSSRI